MALLGALLKEGLLSGEVRALPLSIFGADDVASAFRSLAAGASSTSFEAGFTCVQLSDKRAGNREVRMGLLACVIAATLSWRVHQCMIVMMLPGTHIGKVLVQTAAEDCAAVPLAPPLALPQISFRCSPLPITYVG